MPSTDVGETVAQESEGAHAQQRVPHEKETAFFDNSLVERPVEGQHSLQAAHCVVWGFPDVEICLQVYVVKLCVLFFCMRFRVCGHSHNRSEKELPICNIMTELCTVISHPVLGKSRGREKSS